MSAACPPALPRTKAHCLTAAAAVERTPAVQTGVLPANCPPDRQNFSPFAACSSSSRPDLVQCCLCLPTSNRPVQV